MWKTIVHRALRGVGYDLVNLDIDGAIASKLEMKIIERGKSLARKVSPELKILNGPFKGLKYPSLDITEAALMPKIVGSYEAQLHPAIEKIVSTDYSDIIDIGSAEGYYAIGFAMKKPRTIVHCYDINTKDLEFSKVMAKCNNVDNLTYNNLCTTETLLNFNFIGRGFILCDCEGFELNLFTPEVVDKLCDVDVLVELHDIANPIISSELLSRFQHTHNFEVINNLQVSWSNLIGLEELTQEEREFATLEHRGGFYKNIFMEWALFTSKNNRNTN